MDFNDMNKQTIKKKKQLLGFIKVDCPTCNGTGYTQMFGLLGSVCGHCNGYGIRNMPVFNL